MTHRGLPLPQDPEAQHCGSLDCSPALAHFWSWKYLFSLNQATLLFPPICLCLNFCSGTRNPGDSRRCLHSSNSHWSLTLCPTSKGQANLCRPLQYPREVTWSHGEAGGTRDNTPPLLLHGLSETDRRKRACGHLMGEGYLSVCPISAESECPLGERHTSPSLSI